ncbi:MAG: iron-containing alcohol dehydrogenase [Firmicutes bacterium]|nr:iron-containing alcohol dehydrogenase [Bacillota bacterium]
MENTHNFILPRTNLIGVGAIKDLPTQLLDWKLKKALIVTDKNMITLGYVEQVETILKNLFISYDIFDGVLHPNPTVSYVEDALTYFEKGLNPLKRDYSLIISIGGGTNHDCAKAIATVATNGGSIIDYEGFQKVRKPVVPQIAINTTSGSAAELTMFCIIVDESRKVKMAIGDPKITPYISVNDPLFMSSMPKEVTASSGIDVVSHAVEALVSTEATPITDHLAMGALELAFGYLRRAYENGNDLEAREKMMYGSVMAGMAFNSAGLGYVHAISHQLGGAYQQAHGDYNAILLPYVIEFNSAAIPEERLLDIAAAVGETAGNKNKAVDKICGAIRRLSSDIGIPSGLEQMGANKDDFSQLAQNALKDITTFTNPQQGAGEDIVEILTRAY